MADEGTWYFLGGIAALLGVAGLEDARRHNFFRPFQLFWALMAGLLLRRFGRDLWAAGDCPRLVAMAFTFCATSPVLGYLWWGRQESIRRFLFHCVGFALLLVVAVLAWSLFLGGGRRSIILALVTAAVPFLPFRRWRYSLWRRQILRASPSSPVRSGDHADATGELAKLRERLVTLERGEHVRRDQSERKRQETLEQVLLVRQGEVERIRAGEEGLRFHPSFGFLMAEAWRTLRAEIAAGERIPPLEHDEFFRQVVADLLADPHFEARYLHPAGREAIVAVNAYLAGLQPLPAVVAAIRELALQPDQLAPRPIAGELAPLLVDAWLVPHRRFQRSSWERFADGEHPRQQDLEAFLAELGASEDLSGEERWQQLWDEHPSAFLTTPDREVATDAPEPL